MKILDTISSKVSGAAAVLATVCTLLLALAITADVLARFLTGRSLVGMVELSETLLVSMVFLGLAYCGYLGAHISMNLVTAALPGRAAAVARTIAYALVTALLVWMLWATAGRALDSFFSGEFKFGLAQWPLWPARTAIAVGILITIPVFLLTLWGNVLAIFGKQAAVAPPAEDPTKVAA
ncbi:TRAP transporter small permease [Ruicaihuangia caeni]|uniref:TRAP transporter small permease n=1 Tax=Ruicaihuangia caeni TaxID=3042517 RepID=A0AAW6T6L6_9MICO|nr:TRAP transporter small permease [Klugiella sp. YN-L-19]MDI2099470.1 TRAP transporter small permease [Klugiella sp. YN-L-19]